MDKNKSLTIEKTLDLAMKNHQDGKTDIAQKFYNQVLNIYQILKISSIK